MIRNDFDNDFERVEPVPVYTENKYRYGGYMLVVGFWNTEKNYCNVSMYDLSALHFPLVWSKTMKREAAAGAVALFENSGFFEMPVEV